MSSVFGLNASPHTATRVPATIAAKRRGQLREHAVLLIVVHRLDRFENAQARRLRRARSARAPSRPWGSTSRRSPGPGNRNAGSDALVAADALAHDDRRSRRRARTGSAMSFMNEMRVASMRVRRVLRHLGGRDVHEDDRLARAHERRVQLGHHAARVIRLGAEHDAVGLHEVVDRRAFLQELGIADDVKRKARVPRRRPRRPSPPCRRAPSTS